MTTIARLVLNASLLADRARASMLLTLMDGRALTAGELAKAAGITPQTASAHLNRLVEQRAIVVERQGRHRYHRLAGPEIAAMIEAMMAQGVGNDREAPGGSSRAPVVGPRDRALRHARTCYDHLAGEIAVAIADRMSAAGHVQLSPEGGVVTEAGLAFLDQHFGSPMHAATGRVFCKPCLDWSERRPHLAGAIGRAMLTNCLERGWLRRHRDSRSLDVTPPGRLALTTLFGRLPDPPLR